MVKQSLLGHHSQDWTNLASLVWKRLDHVQLEFSSGPSKRMLLVIIYFIIDSLHLELQLATWTMWYIVVRNKRNSLSRHAHVQCTPYLTRKIHLFSTKMKNKHFPISVFHRSPKQCGIFFFFFWACKGKEFAFKTDRTFCKLCQAQELNQESSLIFHHSFCKYKGADYFMIHQYQLLLKYLLQRVREEHGQEKTRGRGEEGEFIIHVRWPIN